MTANKGNITWLSYLILDVHLHTSRALEIMRHMESIGYHNALIATRSANYIPKNSNQHLILFPLRYKELISQILFTMCVFLYLPIHILKEKPRFIIVSADFSIFGTIPCALIARVMRTKFVLDVRSTPVDESVCLSAFLRKQIFSISVLVAKKLYSGFTIITSMMKKELCFQYKIYPQKVGIWTSGVTLDSFNPIESVESGRDLRKQLGLENKFIVFYHGSLSNHRGITKAIEAIRLIGQNYPDVVLFLLGSPIYPKLEELLKESPLNSQVLVHSPVAYHDVPKFISFADVCIIPLPDMPFWRAQSPLKLLEYLAMEKTVIVSDIPAHINVIGIQPCGIYLQSVTPEEIATCIKYAYENKYRLKQWGKFGRIIIQEKFTWQKIALDLERYLICIN
jgi:glycosyltransferase involved in cell wall biosynthesis